MKFHPNRLEQHDQTEKEKPEAKARTTASVEWSLFQKAQHAMAVVEAPEEYKTEHVDRLLRKCPEWVA